MKNKSVPAFLLTLLLGFGLLQTSCDRQPETQEDLVIVRVGDAMLKLDDLVDEIPPGLKHRISKEQLQDYVVRWINSQILYQEARRRGLDRDPSIQRELKRVERELAVSALLDREIYQDRGGVSQAQVQEYYDRNRESFRRNEPEALLYHISAPTRAAADSLYRALRSGPDFRPVARRMALTSPDTSSWSFRVMLSEVPEAMRPIFRQRPGSVAAPLELDDGYHLFQLAELYPEGTFRDMSMVREDIVNRIQVRGRDDRYRTLLAELRAGTSIETNFQMLESMPLDSIYARVARLSSKPR